MSGGLFGQNYGSSHTRRLTTMCGCYFFVERQPRCLPQVDVAAHTTIIGTSSRTTLRQTFLNASKDKLDEIQYAFPLYDGVSVVGFKCTIGDRVIEGTVKERQQAKAVYEDAKAQGQTTGLLEQSLSAADVFSTRIGNVPANEKVFVDITYLGELAHDAELDGVRFTIPTNIAPRYGGTLFGEDISSSVKDGRISFTIDVEMPAGSTVKKVQSPSHPLSVNIGTTSKAPDADPSFQKATASLSLNTAELDKDFVVQVVASNLGDPIALLETHPTIPNQRALMTTLVPKFTLPADKPEIVFICDRSGSMGNQIRSLVAALNIFLKSLPVGVKFNICSFGSRYEFLWPKSQSYSQASLDQATEHVSTFSANFGGTEMFEPVEEAFKRRYTDMNLEVFVLTDGEIWDQDRLFNMINTNVRESKGAIRVFSLGVGSGCSTSLVEGIARAGNGMAQFVQDGETMNKKIVRMLKASLFPHIKDYSLEIKYGKASKGDMDDDDDFVLVEKVNSALTLVESEKEELEKSAPKPTISLFNKDLKEDTSAPSADTDPLPCLPAPRYLQTPTQIPALFPFSRATVYVLLSDSCPHHTPESVILRGTSPHGPLELEIPITVLTDKATTIHQLAVRKELKELEEGRGSVSFVTSGDKNLKDKHPGRYDDIVEREGVRLGTTFQVTGKWCPFVAVEKAYKDGKLKVTETEAPLHVPEEVTYQLAQQTYMCSAPVVPAPRARNMFGPLMARKPMPATGGARSPSPPGAAPPPPPPMASGGFGSAAPAGLSTGGLFGSTRGPPGGLFGSSSASVPAPDGLSGSSSGGFGLFGNSGGGGAAVDAAAPSLFGKGGSGGGDMEEKKRAPRGGFGLFGNSTAAAAPPKQEASTGDPLQVLTSLQLFEGNWRWSPALEKILGLNAHDALNKATQAGLPSTISWSDNMDDILATTCAIAYFKTKLANNKETWEMIVEKAEAWLRAKVGNDLGALEKAVA